MLTKSRRAASFEWKRVISTLGSHQVWWLVEKAPKRVLAVAEKSVGYPSYNVREAMGPAAGCFLTLPAAKRWMEGALKIKGKVEDER